jgi:hypothetical protein
MRPKAVPIDHADAGGVALAQHVAGHHLAGREQVRRWAGRRSAQRRVSSTFRPR